MREIIIGEKTLRLRATPLALLFYKQEFKTDLIGDLLKMQKMQDDPSQFDSIALLQLLWAMNKADNYQEFPSFLVWIEDLGSFDLQNIMTEVMEEATDGFFRGTGK